MPLPNPKSKIQNLKSKAPTSETPASKTFQLIYRGLTFERTLPPVQLNHQPDTDKTIKLVYRGQTYHHAPAPARPYRQQAVNWRFQFA